MKTFLASSKSKCCSNERKLLFFHLAQWKCRCQTGGDLQVEKMRALWRNEHLIGLHWHHNDSIELKLVFLHPCHATC